MQRQLLLANGYVCARRQSIETPARLCCPVREFCSLETVPPVRHTVAVRSFAFALALLSFGHDVQCKKPCQYECFAVRSFAAPLLEWVGLVFSRRAPFAVPPATYLMHVVLWMHFAVHTLHARCEGAKCAQRWKYRSFARFLHHSKQAHSCKRRSASIRRQADSARWQ